MTLYFSNKILTLPSVHRDFGASSVLLQQVFHKIRRRRRRESFEGVWCGRCDAPTSKKLKNRGFRRAPKARGEKPHFWTIPNTPKFVSAPSAPTFMKKSRSSGSAREGGGLTLGMHLISKVCRSRDHLQTCAARGSISCRVLAL